MHVPPLSPSPPQPSDGLTPRRRYSRDEMRWCIACAVRPREDVWVSSGFLYYVWTCLSCRAVASEYRWNPDE